MPVQVWYVMNSTISLSSARNRCGRPKRPPAGAFADENLRTFAAAIGLNEGDFSSCLGSNRYRNEINDGIVEARDLGVQSTPTFAINGQLVEGGLSFEQFQSIIEQELSQAQ
jgi:protein-disulfide isomerase